MTEAMTRDLRYLVALFRLSVGVGYVNVPNRPPVGDSVRTGKALERIGMVQRAALQYSNREATWTPTNAGLRWVDQAFKRFDDGAQAAIDDACRHLWWAR